MIDIRRQPHRTRADLQPPNRVLTRGEDHARIEDPEGIEAFLDQLEQAQNLGSIDPSKTGRTEPPSSMLARDGAAEADDDTGHLVEQIGDAGLPSWPGHVRKQVYVDMAVTGMTKDHDGQ